MWRNPRYPAPEQPPPPTAPQDLGRRLATIPRGRDEELRVSVAEFQGRPYLSLRVWAKGSDGSYWPLKGKGLSIRVREINDVAEALAAASRVLDLPPD